MDWPNDLIAYRCDFYLQNRTTAFRSPITGTRQVLRRQGERWIGTYSFRFDRTKAQRMDAHLAKMKGQRVTSDMWDHARKTPLGSNTDLSSYADTYFADASSPNLTEFTDGTHFDAGTALWLVDGAHAIGVETVSVNNLPQSITDLLLAGDYVKIGGYLYMLTADLDSDALGEGTMSLNRPLVAALTDGATITRTYCSTPMQLLDDDQPARSVDYDGVYEYNISVVEAFF